MRTVKPDPGVRHEADKAHSNLRHADYLRIYPL
ncbi:hypothetical protein PbB2_03103 [Candidatus Phycosocius bacilliformis]|uniref:Uncharacterized protein n=1 Tax=Candidatus Phycosocius bacilliformis TaxID=1445552 RepID=A0A2P2EEB4_9PROT|nr:hypothetical protein PbB2_03103 [Candidatus Phycosocius bacilliformis]